MMPLSPNWLLGRHSLYTGGARAAGGSRKLGQRGRGGGYEQPFNCGRLFDLRLRRRWLARWFLGRRGGSLGGCCGRGRLFGGDRDRLG